MSSHEKQHEKNSKNVLEKNKNPKHISQSKKFNSKSSQSEHDIPEITEWRRAIMKDKNGIKTLKSLTGHIACTLFRRNDIDEFIETSYFPIVQFDSNGDLVSFTVFDSYPDIQSKPFFWKEWMNIKYQIKGVAEENVLFVHYMLWHPKHEKEFLFPLLETIFTEFVHLNLIIIVKPPKVDVPNFYSEYFISVLPVGAENFDISSVQFLLLCLKPSIINPLDIRTAFETEFNVILNIIKNDLKKTKTGLTSTNLLNLLYQKNNKTLICEYEGNVMGIMILNLKINLQALNEWFELGPFNGLKKKNSEEKDVYWSSSIPKVSSSNIQKDENILVSSEFLFTQMNWEMVLSEIKPNDSVLEENYSSSSIGDSQFSQLSLFRLSSVDNKEDSNSISPISPKSDQLFKIGGINLVIRPSENSITHYFPPKYHGDSNAFVIEFFALDSNKVDEKITSFDFLKAAFKIVPDKEYCALLLPTDLLPFPLLDSFIRVTPRPSSSFKYELYLCHKNSLSVMSLSVRSTEKDDLDSIKNFLKNVHEGENVYQDILNSCFGENNGFKSFVFTFDKTVVGVSLINSQGRIENFHMYFEVPDFSSSAFGEPGNFSIIKHLILNPIYYKHARFFIRDIMRLEAVNCVYYAGNKNDFNILTVLGEFALVKPKKKVLYKELLQVDIPSPENQTQRDYFSLYFLTPRLCGLNKKHMNIVLVVVGASRTALSFLENLILGSESWLFNYNNIICVTASNFENKTSETDITNLMIPNMDSFSKKYLSMLPFETYVKFIYGIMTKINRSEKYIVVNNKAVIKYDYLILTCGLQYSIPIPEAKKVFSKPRCLNHTSSLTRFLPRFLEKRKIYIPKHLNNMFIINTSSDARSALKILQYLMHKMKKSGDKKIIVYGHDLQVFLTIHTLLKLGIPGDFIVFVEPFPSETTTVTLFNDHSIDQAVLESVREFNVNYYTNYILYDWSLSSEDYITAIKFHSSCKQMVIPCLAFFPFLEKLVSDVNFNVCNNAGLVFDGKLVINHNFRTNDKNIYAAGPFTKYAKRYFASEYSHQYYNSREIGQKLAEIIKDIIHPTEEKKIEEENTYLVPQFKAPIVLHCQLPGDFNFFILRKPGKEVDLETAYNFYNYGEVLTTGDCKMKNGFGYFRLHLNPEGFVETITCYTKDKIDYENLSSLYGLHERILNNLLLRFDLSLIPNLFEYFRQPWALALYHEDFQRLHQCNFKAFSKKGSYNKTLYGKIIKELKANDWESLPDSLKEELELTYLHSKMSDDIKVNLMQYLDHHRNELPVYYNFNTMKYRFKKKAEL